MRSVLRFAGALGRRAGASYLAVAALVPLFLGACDGGTVANVDVSLELVPDPPQTGPATFVVGLSDESGVPVEGATVRVEGNMNHAGMVPVFADAVETEPGRYRGELEFTMGGDWFVIVTATMADGEELSSTVDVPGVQRRKASGG